MQFDSLFFFLFFLIVVTVYHVLSSWTEKKIWLLAVSYFFYAAWRPPLIILLLLSTAIDWIAARQIYRARTKKRKLLWLVVSLSTNLGLLVYFKYAGFLSEIFNEISLLAGWKIESPVLDIVLPIGISFYTFQTLSYTIDVYRNKCKADYSLLDFALYVGFFPQLVAGPIVRAVQFLPQLKRERFITRENLSRGMILFLFGLFAKVVLADALFAPAVDQIYRQTTANFFDSIIAIFAFSGQIYFDFSGYTNCALGLAIVLGFTLPENFRAPYAASGISDFWRRWHISLSSWLRDYLYISLGGNRRGQLRTVTNLLVTMLLGGLWHGAAWNFVIWGFLHGVYLMIEHVLLTVSPLIRKSISSLTARFITFVIVSVLWVFFRAENLSQASIILRGLLDYSSTSKTSLWYGLAILTTAAVMFSWHQWTRNIRAYNIFSRFPFSIRSLILALTIVGIFIASKGDSRAFIYFQF